MRMFMQAVLEAHDAHAHRTVLEVGIARLAHGVEIDVHHVVQHAHRGADGALELVVIQLAVFQVVHQVDRAQVANRDFMLVGVERDLGAQVGAVHHAHVLLRAAHVARVLEGDPGMAGFEQHGEHLAPQLQRRKLPEQLDLAARGLVFIGGVGSSRNPCRSGRAGRARRWARTASSPCSPSPAS